MIIDHRAAKVSQRGFLRAFVRDERPIYVDLGLLYDNTIVLDATTAPQVVLADSIHKVVVGFAIVMVSFEMKDTSLAKVHNEHIAGANLIA